MNNTNIMLLGQTGAGKSNMSRYLLRQTPRAFVLDRKGEYDDGAVFTDFSECLAFFKEAMEKDSWHIIYFPRDSEDVTTEFVAWLDILWTAQNEYDLPPLGLFIEEASFLSSTHNVDRAVEKIYTLGREPKISTVTISQRDTQINKLLRTQTHMWVSMRQRNPSSDVKEVFTSEDLEMLPKLKTLMPRTVPKYGVHYLTDLGDMEVVSFWLKHL